MHAACSLRSNSEARLSRSSLVSNYNVHYAGHELSRHFGIPCSWFHSESPSLLAFNTKRLLRKTTPESTRPTRFPLRTCELVTMGSLRLSVWGLLFLSNYLSHHFTVAQSEFAAYPQCSQGCFVASATTAGIELSNKPSADNGKLCTNVQYLQLVAKCVKVQCSANTFESIANATKKDCDSTNTPLVLTVSQLIELGGGTTNTTSSSLPLSGTTSPNSPTSSSKSTSIPSGKWPSIYLVYHQH
jgi:hypothetical protein